MFMQSDPRKIIGIVKGVNDYDMETDLYVCRNTDNGELLLSKGFGLEFDLQVSLAYDEVLKLIDILNKPLVDKSLLDSEQHSFKLSQHGKTILEYVFTLHPNGVGHSHLWLSDSGEDEEDFNLGNGANDLLIEYLKFPDKHMTAYDDALKPKKQPAFKFLSKEHLSQEAMKSRISELEKEVRSMRVSADHSHRKVIKRMKKERLET
jgi:hypothetical protein